VSQDPGTPGDGLTPDGLDIAVDWLQKRVDDLAAVTRAANASAANPALPSVGLPPAIQAPPAQPAGAPTPVAPAAHASTPATAAAAATPARPASGPPSPPARPTPLLDQIGRDLTALARAGELPAVVGRDAELAYLIEILCRPQDRGAMLVAPAGTGKTAVVEGLAQLIAAGSVPAPLRSVRVIEVPLPALLAGTQLRGQLEDRTAQLVAEASQPSIVVFFDDVDRIARPGDPLNGVGDALRPELANGTLAVIGATAPEDYAATIAANRGLASHVTTVEVKELDREATRKVLAVTRDGLAKSRGITVSDGALDVLLDFADKTIANRRFPDKALDLLQQAVARSIVAGKTTVDRADAEATTKEWLQRASATPTLDRFGRDLIKLAQAGQLSPVIGRDRETAAMIDVLLRHTKRNPLLLGPAGAGKTACVEGLAQRIAAGNVPAPLQHVKIVDVPLLPLAAAVTQNASLLADFLLEARHPSVIVFFDEIHLLAAPAVHDLAESLKPVLARGDIACIGATTGEEFQADLEPETALARRFTPIAIEPLDDAATRNVLAAVRDKLAKSRGVTVDDASLDEMIALANQFLPNRSFPDKGIDLLEQSVAYAVSHGVKAIDVRLVLDAASSLIGMPLDPVGPLQALVSELRASGLLAPDAIDALRARLEVTLRGLDSDGQRPDATLLLGGPAAATADPIADAIARDVFGRATARVDIDLSGMTEDSSISSLLGSAPGLVGSDRALPLHELRRAPWQVVSFLGIDRCAGAIRDTIASALRAGSFTDAMGRGIPLGSAIVILTAPSLPSDGAAGAGVPPAAILGPDLVAAVDVTAISAAGIPEGSRAAWIQRELLAPFAARLARRGYQVTFDDAFVTWVAANLPPSEAPSSFMDHDVAPALAALLPASPASLVATIAAGKPTLSPASAANPPAAPPPAAPPSSEVAPQ
jgi:ATP-dependent Clp protease ATP-binding subunit ClpC